jgi:hypothetical protein
MSVGGRVKLAARRTFSVQRLRALNSAAAGQKLHHKNYKRYYQQEVDQTATYMNCEPECPQN